MSNIVKNYLRVLEVISSLNCELEFKSGVGRRHKMSDIEVIALSLTAEYMSIDSENDLFKQLVNGSIPNLIERSQFNKRRRKLFEFSERIRISLACSFLEFENYFFIDCMPLEICKKHVKIGLRFVKKILRLLLQNDIVLHKTHGFMVINYMEFVQFPEYFIRLISLKQTFMDIQILKDVKNQLFNCVLLGDRGYLSSTQQLDLFQTANIVLETPMRMNQKSYVTRPYIFRKSRKKIETLFSQLCDRFKIRNNYAKSFEGFKTRILAKITALTLVQYINKFIFDKPINIIKFQII